MVINYKIDWYLHVFYTFMKSIIFFLIFFGISRLHGLSASFFQIFAYLQNIFRNIYWKKSAYEWIHAIQAHVVPGLIALIS